jgi:hypothetical protein
MNWKRKGDLMVAPFFQLNIVTAPGIFVLAAARTD